MQPAENTGMGNGRIGRRNWRLRLIWHVSLTSWAADFTNLHAAGFRRKARLASLINRLILDLPKISPDSRAYAGKGSLSVPPYATHAACHDDGRPGLFQAAGGCRNTVRQTFPADVSGRLAREALIYRA